MDAIGWARILGCSALLLFFSLLLRLILLFSARITISALITENETFERLCQSAGDEATRRGRLRRQEAARRRDASTLFLTLSFSLVRSASRPRISRVLHRLCRFHEEIIRQTPGKLEKIYERENYTGNRDFVDWNPAAGSVVIYIRWTFN